MAFTLRDDLAPELWPLAWLVGTWRGFGLIGYPPDVEERTVVQEVTVDHDGGPYLRVVTTIWLADPELSGPVQPETSGAAGYRALVKDVLWSTETSYWRPVAAAPTEEGTRVELEVVCADPSGLLSLYLGAAEGPRISLATDAVVAAPRGAAGAAASRLYGLVDSDLLWVQELAAFGQPLGSYASGRLSRTE